MRRTYALRFALAYLFALDPVSRQPFDEIWSQFDSDNNVHRFRRADMALDEICKRLGAPRDEGIAQECWRAAQARYHERRKAGA